MRKWEQLSSTDVGWLLLPFQGVSNVPTTHNHQTKLGQACNQRYTRYFQLMLRVTFFHSPTQNHFSPAYCSRHNIKTPRPKTSSTSLKTGTTWEMAAKTPRLLKASESPTARNVCIITRGKVSQCSLPPERSKKTLFLFLSLSLSLYTYTHKSLSLSSRLLVLSDGQGLQRAVERAACSRTQLKLHQEHQVVHPNSRHLVEVHLLGNSMRRKYWTASFSEAQQKD